MISAVWLTGLNVLSLARGFVVAGFLATSEYGTWGVVVAVLATVLWLRDIGLADRFVQQRDEDQERAFQVFFTLELSVAFVLFAVMAIVMPIYALALGQPSVLLPGLALALTPFSIALQTPIQIFYRDMNYLQQRLLQSVDPIAGFVVTVGLAIAGLGVWALVLGSLVGSFGQVVVAVRASPYRLRLRRPGQDLREYMRFSWPLIVASGSGIIMVQATVFAGSASVGLAGLGAITLANNVTRYTGQVDKIVTDTFYPAICRIVDKPALLYESFVKSSRLALMWGVPFGIGVALFSQDLVTYVLGHRWQPAVLLLQSLGIVTAITQIGFNWTAYFRAIGRTKPFATTAVATCVAFLVTCVPLLLADGLRGLAIGSVALGIVQMLFRVHYLRELFPRFSWWKQAARATTPVLPATAAVLGARLAFGDLGAIGEAGLVVAFVVLTGLATAWFERDLLGEALGYIRGRAHQVAVA